MNLMYLFIAMMIIGVLLLNIFQGSKLLRCPNCKKMGGLEAGQKDISSKVPITETQQKEPIPHYICKYCKHKVYLPK